MKPPQELAQEVVSQCADVIAINSRNRKMTEEIMHERLGYTELIAVARAAYKLEKAQALLESLHVARLVGANVPEHVNTSDLRGNFDESIAELFDALTNLRAKIPELFE